MTQESNVLVAVDMGTTKVCTIVARREGAGSFRVLSFSVLPSEGLARGVVTDVPEAGDVVRRSILDAARQAGVAATSAYVGITGSHVTFENRMDNIDWAASLGVITRDDLERVPSVVAEAGAAPGMQVIHALPRSYTLDGQRGIRNPLGLHTRRLEVESHVVSADVQLVRNLTDAVARAGLSVDALVLDPVASAEAVLTEREKRQGVVLVDMGGGTSDIIVFDRGAAELTSVLPVGGFQFTNDICITYRTNYTAAEEVKLEHGHADPTQFRAADEALLPIADARGSQHRRVALRELSQLMRERALEMSRLIRIKIMEAGYQNPADANVVLTGGCSRLPGMEELFKRRLTPNLRVGGPSPDLDVPEGLRGPEFSTSVGLLRWAVNQPAPADDAPIESAEQTTADASEQSGSRPRLLRWLFPR